MTSEYIDLKNIVVFGEKDLCGSVDSFSIEGHDLDLHGRFSSDDAEGWTVVAADKYRRFLTAGETTDARGWSLRLDLRRLHNLPAKSPLTLYGLRPGTNQLYPVGMGADLPERLQAYVEANQTEGVAELPSHREQYIHDIVEATKVRYVSTSIQDNIRTGNNYQSINLEKILREGTRTNRNDFLRQVDFKGKSVLDIGANTGEMSRAIRLLGADLVDGVEYDSFFVETGRMINAVMGATRVSLFQGDVTHPGFYKDKKYDIVVALSVFVYIKGVMENLAAMTDVLVFETHTLDHGLKMYLDAVLPHFPVYRHVGYSQMNDDPRRSRAFLVFARDEASLASAFEPRHLRVESYFPNKFLEEYGSSTPGEFLGWATEIRAATDIVELSREKMGFGSKAYFASYLIGYLEYLENGSVVAAENYFLRRYRASIEDESIDSKLKPLLTDMERIVQKVTAKFRDLDHCLAGEFHRVPLIYLSLASDGKHVFTDVDGRELRAGNIDGHHRFFIAQVLGLKTIAYMTSERRPEFTRKIKSSYSLS